MKRAMDQTTHSHHLVGFEECTFVLRNSERFGVEHASYPGAEEIRGRRGVQLIDGEPHRKLHTFLTRYFSSHAETLRLSIMRPRIADAMKLCAERAEVEVFQQIAAPLSLQIIAAVLGLPHDDDEFLATFAEWRDSMTPWVATRGTSLAERHAAIAAASKLREAAMPAIRARKVDRRSDLLSALWSVGPSVFPDWSEDDVMDQCRIMLLAGSDGVARLTSTSFHLGLAVSSLRSEIASGNAHAASVLVDYACRLYPPAQLRPRTAQCSVKVGERQIAAGDQMYLDVVEANRDAARSASAHPMTSRHLTFSIGARFCSGAPLACAEAEEVVAAFFRTFPGCARMDGAPAPQFEGLLFLGFSPVHIRLRAEGVAA